MVIVYDWGLGKKRCIICLHNGIGQVSDLRSLQLLISTA